MALGSNLFIFSHILTLRFSIFSHQVFALLLCFIAWTFSLGTPSYFKMHSMASNKLRKSSYLKCPWFLTVVCLQSFTSVNDSHPCVTFVCVDLCMWCVNVGIYTHHFHTYGFTSLFTKGASVSCYMVIFLIWDPWKTFILLIKNWAPYL